MPLDVNVDKDAMVVQLTCTGTMVASDLMDYEREFWIGDEHLGFHHLVDFRGCELRIEYADILVLATHASPTEDSPYMCARSAFIGGGEDQLEKLDFFKHARHQICEPAIREVGVFDDLREGREWLTAASVILL